MFEILFPVSFSSGWFSFEVLDVSVTVLDVYRVLEYWHRSLLICDVAYLHVIQVVLLNAGGRKLLVEKRLNQI